jgi:hypothetical protein
MSDWWNTRLDRRGGSWAPGEGWHWHNPGLAPELPESITPVVPVQAVAEPAAPRAGTDDAIESRTLPKPV